MVTDDERREVARRLRGLRSGWLSGECYYTIIHALGLPDTSREDGGHALYSALADLIEPSCDRDALLALADVMERKASNWDVTQGDVPLVHAGHLLGYADRIREALGDCQRGVSGAGDRGVSRGPSGQVAGVARAASREGAGEKE